MAKEFSVTVDSGTITATVTSSGYAASSATIQVTNADGTTLPLALPMTSGNSQTWTFNGLASGTYTVTITCGGESNVSTLNVP